MKKLVVLSAIAIVLVWGMALLDFGASAPEPAPTPPPAPAPEPPAGDVEPDAAAPDAAPHGRIAVRDGRRDPDFRRMAQLFVTEPRDGTWASAEERRLFAFMEASGWRADALVHCRTTVCRIEVPAGSPEDLATLLQAPGGPEAMRATEGWSYVFENGMLQTYTRRESASGDGTAP